MYNSDVSLEAFLDLDLRILICIIWAAYFEAISIYVSISKNIPMVHFLENHVDLKLSPYTCILQCITVNLIPHLLSVKASFIMALLT